MLSSRFTHETFLTEDLRIQHLLSYTANCRKSLQSREEKTKDIWPKFYDRGHDEQAVDGTKAERISK